jgi:signal-transduction protein with cAMP-binding, CBS, and nucleotidyltransferase domain
MTEEDIYEMISEAGMYVSNFDRFIGRVWCSDEYPIDEELFRFAALVAAHEREACRLIVLDNSDAEGICCTDDVLEAFRHRGKE